MAIGGNGSRREPARPLFRPVPGPRPVQTAVMVLARTLARERSVAQAVAAVDAFFQVGEEHLERLQESTPPRAPIACREGCAHCCHCGQVVVTPPEVVRVVAWLREHLDAFRLAALAGRCADLASDFRARGKPGAPLSPLPCPLLDDSRCLAYPARPFVCRGCNSFDARRCADAFGPSPGDREVPAHLPQVELWHSLRTGMSMGLAALGYPRELLDLAVALDIALADPDAVDAWLRGEPVFAEAGRSPTALPLAGRRGWVVRW